MSRCFQLALGAIVAAIAPVGLAAEAPYDVTEFVDTTIGTDGGGNTHPGALWPFGMVQPGPDTADREDGDYGSEPSGYVYRHGYLFGFTQTHLSGTGCTDLMDFLLLPFTGRDPAPDRRLTRKLDKSTERGRPGYYAVQLEDGDIACELTASPRVAYHRYTLVRGGKLKVLLDAQAGSYAWWRRERPPHRVTFAESAFDEKAAVFEGHNRVNCWNDNRDIFVKIAFDPKPNAVRELGSNGRNGRRLVLEFNLPAKGAVVAKAAISSVDAEGARRNFAADPEGFDFDARRRDCTIAWRRQLGRLVAVGDEAKLKCLYAALYHTMVQPNLFSDADGRARFADQAWGSPFTGKVMKAKDFDVYTTFSTWDTFRAAHPWYTIFNPGVVDDFCKSMMLSYEAIGKLPIWQMFGGENYCMPGVHSIPVLADAMLKGLTDLDPQSVVRAMDVSLAQRFAEAPDYDKLGYWAYEIGGASVSRTLECGIDDYATMKVAELAKDWNRYKYYERRAGYFRNLFDPATGCMRARNREGKFREPFDPYKQKPTEEDKRNRIPNDYTEGGAWQYAFHVLQSPFELIDLHGGPDRLGDALEKLFTDNTQVDADRATVECSGRIGQFALGNEHDQHVPYLFQAAWRPERTEEIVRELCDRYFRPTPDGICGNDDCGQISAWYLFTCLGFYPVNPVGGDYFLGAPQLPRISLALENGKVFTVIAKGISESNKYVKAVTLDGRPYDSMILKHADIVKGGELVFEMSDRPKHLTGESRADRKPMRRWRIVNGGKRIVWDVKGETRLPHRDMLEMSGLKSAIVLSYGLDASRRPSLKRSVIWPQYRTQPNNTHGSACYEFDGAKSMSFLLNGKALAETVDEISFDGVWSCRSTDGAAALTRRILPCADKPAAVEMVSIRNLGKEPIEVKPVHGDFRDYRIGCDARYEVRCDVTGGDRVIQPGKNASWSALYSIRRIHEPVVTAVASEELVARYRRIVELASPLVLETGDEVVDAMFRFAKIRAGESIFTTKRGLMHSPGGGPGAFYAATWCNDQVEYAGPWFAFTGDRLALAASTNAYAHYMPFMGPDYAQIPSSVIAEGLDYWNADRDRGDAAMWAYGMSRFVLAANDRTAATNLLPGLRWTLEYCRRQLNDQGVVGSFMDELEGRFPHGKYNLCTSTLYYDALRHAAIVEREIGDAKLADDYLARAAAVRAAVEGFFGAEIHGFKTYRYFEDCKVLRSWIGIPLAMGIYDRAEGTIGALFSPYLWNGSELYTEEADPRLVVWDRSLMYALRGICAAGRTERVWEYLKAYSESRLLGEHVPYALECTDSMSHLSAENALYCRIFTEGLFGMDPNGFGTFAMTGRLPAGFKPIRLRKVRIDGKLVDLALTPTGVKTILVR